MRSLRPALLFVLLGFAALGGVAATPGKAEAYFYRYGAYRYPYYWSGGTTRYTKPYSYYTPNSYYGVRNYTPYHSMYSHYPWRYYY